MRSEWVPLSAAALITGAMTLVVSRFITMDISGEGMAAVLESAEQHPGRWAAMGVLWSVSGIGFVLGSPCLVVAMSGRGRKFGYVGITLFAIGAVGVSGFAALSMVIRAMALSDVPPEMAQRLSDNTGLVAMLATWMVAFYLGLVVISLALLLARTVAPWIPILLLVFVAAQVATEDIYVLQSAAYLAMAAGFSGIAIEVANVGSREPVLTDR